MLITYTHTNPFNGPFSGTTWVSEYEKGKTNLDFTQARDSEWQWHQLGHMQVCISLQTDNHASTTPLSFFTSRMPFLPTNQQCQSTEGKCMLINLYEMQKAISRCCCQSLLCTGNRTMITALKGNTTYYTVTN